MTHSEADNLIATLPKPGGLRLFREDDRIVMDGGKWGAHALSTKVSSAERLLVHWKGYVENQGLSLGPGYTIAKPSAALIPHLKNPDRDYQAGDKIAFSSPSYSGKGAHGYRPGGRCPLIVWEAAFQGHCWRTRGTGAHSAADQ